MTHLPRRAPVALFVCLLLAAPVFAGPHLVVSATAQRFPDITLSVHATTKDGKPITDLASGDFKVFEDLAPAKITDVEQLRGGSTRPIDITFVFDSTGSMSEEIAGLVRRAKRFADLLVQSNLDYRLALIPFGDMVGAPSEPTHDIDAFKKTLSALTASGGGDEPENQLGALDAASKLPGRSGARRVLVLITDATFHSADAVTPLTADEVVERLRKSGIELHIVGPDIDQYRWMSAALSGTFFDKDSGEFEQLVNSLGGELAANYLVTYRSPRPQDDGTRRSVTLTAKHSSGTGEDASQYVAPGLVSVSSRREKLRGDESAYSPHFAVDNNPATAWVADAAEGEWLTLSFEQPRRISRLVIRPSAITRFAVPRTLELRFDDTLRRTVTMDGTRNLQTLAVEPPVEAKKLQVIVRTAEPASSPVAIAELSVGEGDVETPELARLHHSADELSLAARLNKSGEKAYHSGKLDESVKLYLAAVDKAPEFAQGWSNLGLSYWKLKRYPDSVSANRQAILLARRQGTPQVVANSYYSMGRTFEEQSQLKQALQSFWWANQATPKDTYQTAIDRLTRRLAEDTP